MWGISPLEEPEKTPIVALVVQILQQQGRIRELLAVAIVRWTDRLTTKSEYWSDSVQEFPHEHNSSRYEAARKLISSTDIDTVVMDDGYQHRQLHRELDIVLIDATNPFGYDHLLPRGLLREPLTALQRADEVLINSIGYGRRIRACSDRTACSKDRNETR